MARDWFTEWADLLGRSTVDEEVVLLLRETGVDEVPKVPRNDYSVDLYRNGLALTFEDAELYPDHAGKAGKLAGVLQQVVVFINLGKDLYHGPMPLGLERQDSRIEVRQKLGDPDRSDDDMDYDSWMKGDCELRVRFTGEEPDAGIGAIAMRIETPT